MKSHCFARWMIALVLLLSLSAYAEGDCPTDVPTKIQAKITNTLPGAVYRAAFLPYSQFYVPSKQPAMVLYTGNLTNATTFNVDMCLEQKYSDQLKDVPFTFTRVTYSGTFANQPFSCTFGYTTSFDGQNCYPASTTSGSPYVKCNIGSVKRDGDTCFMQFSIDLAQ